MPNRFTFGRKTNPVLIADITNNPDKLSEGFTENGYAYHSIWNLIEVECDYCGSKFNASPADTNMMGLYKIDCPICKKTLFKLSAYHVHTN